MGQRHQLFVIAKIHGRYRGLAAVHHQWLYGESALHACRQLLSIFQDRHNRHLLESEIAKAKALKPKDWYIGMDYSSQKPMFPFVTTCLLLGASHSPTNEWSNVHLLPWNLDFDQGDNNDGVTILDISQLDTPKYCFVYLTDPDDELEEDDTEEEEPPRKWMVPLRGAEYLTIYYKEREWNSEMKELTGSLDQFNLIASVDLNEAWPRLDWMSRNECGLVHVEEHDTFQAVEDVSLRSFAMEKSIERILDEEDELLPYIEELRSFQSSLKDYLYGNPHVVTSRKFGFELLKKAMAVIQDLDLLLFPDLSEEQFLQLLKGCPGHLNVLDISGNQNITIETISQILEARNVDLLYVWDNSSLQLNDLLPFVKTKRVTKLIHPDIFLAPFLEFEKLSGGLKSWLIEDMDSSPLTPALSISSFQQVVWMTSTGSSYAEGFPKMGHKGTPLGENTRAALQGLSERHHGLSSAAFGLHDVDLSPRELLTSLVKLITSFAMREMLHGTFGSLSTNSLAFPFSFAMHNVESPYAVSNIPASAYVQATSPWASSDAYIQHTMYPLVEGEWAAIVFQNRFQDENIFSRHWRDQFHISFLTLKNGNMHILRVEEFLKETSCEDFEPAWGRNVAEIKSSALEKGNVVEVVDCSEELVGNIMAVMDMVKKGDLEM